MVVDASAGPRRRPGGDARRSSKSRRQPVLVPARSAAGPRRTWGCRAEREVAFEGRRVVGDEVGAVRSGIERRDLGEEPGPVEQLLGQRARGEVADRDQRQPGPGMAGDDARAGARGSTRRSRGRSAPRSRRPSAAVAAAAGAGGTGNAPPAPGSSPRARDDAVERHRGDDDDRLAGLVEPHGAPHLRAAGPAAGRSARSAPPRPARSRAATGGRRARVITCHSCAASRPRTS